MCHTYSSRYKCDCISPRTGQDPEPCSEFLQGKPCNEAEAEEEVSYLSSDCTTSCPSWQEPDAAYREEFRREAADSHLYYGNRDVSQEDIFFEREDLRPKRPHLVLPSYEALHSHPQKSPAHSLKAARTRTATGGGESSGSSASPGTPSSTLLESSGPCTTPTFPETPKTPQTRDREVLSADESDGEKSGWEGNKSQRKGVNVSKPYKKKDLTKERNRDKRKDKK